MTASSSRRSFLASASLATGALASGAVRMAEAQTTSTPVDARVLTAAELAASAGKLKSAPGNDTLFKPEGLPLSIVQTVEVAKSAKEFEWHETRDHVFQITQGACVYELGGTPVSPRNVKPGEWLATASTGARRVEVKAGDMLVVPRGTPHRRSTADSVTFVLISSEGK